MATEQEQQQTAPRAKVAHLYEVRIESRSKPGAAVPVRLVKAFTKAQAVAHVASDLLAAAMPSQERLVQLAREGIQIEDATA